MNNWIECDGGPHILIENRYLKIWKGEYYINNTYR